MMALATMCLNGHANKAHLNWNRTALRAKKREWERERERERETYRWKRKNKRRGEGEIERKKEENTLKEERKEEMMDVFFSHLHNASLRYVSVNQCCLMWWTHSGHDKQRGKHLHLRWGHWVSLSLSLCRSPAQTSVWAHQLEVVRWCVCVCLCVCVCVCVCDA